MSSNTIIEIKNVWKKFTIGKGYHNTLRERLELLFSSKKTGEIDSSEFWALKDINIRVEEGESIGIYGPNGSGKTTIIKLLANVTSPTKGEVMVKGRVAPLISLGVGFHPDLTGKENIYINGIILGMSVEKIKSLEEQILGFSELENKFLDTPVKKYSSGMLARLGFSVAIHSDVDIFLLDETLAVGDAYFVSKCELKIDQIMKNDKKTFVIVSHSLERLIQLTDRVYYINKGSIERVEESGTEDQQSISS